jgi:hypothetical protein
MSSAMLLSLLSPDNLILSDEEETAEAINGNNLYINSPDFFIPGQSRSEEAAVDPNDPYSHVRFGETREILLVEVEWHTRDSFLELAEEWNIPAEHMSWYRQTANEIRDGTHFITRSINGIPGWFFNRSGVRDISQILTPEGYYPYSVYPYNYFISYSDANNNWQNRQFTASSKRHFDRLMENEIIPFCDDLFIRGLINIDEYNYYTMFDPLDYYVNMWFN